MVSRAPRPAGRCRLTTLTDSGRIAPDGRGRYPRGPKLERNWRGLRMPDYVRGRRARWEATAALPRANVDYPHSILSDRVCPTRRGENVDVPTEPGVFVFVRKPAEYTETDLIGYPLFSILTNTKCDSFSSATVKLAKLRHGMKNLLTSANALRTRATNSFNYRVRGGQS